MLRERLVEFEFDEARSRQNADKHGMDFVVAQQLWLDVRMIEIPARPVDEPRWLVVGLVGSTHYSSVITRRGHHIRIISGRRSWKKGVALYEGVRV